jgi:alkylation response protein AidB-like acyl-CoA dehydrogenase
MLRRHLDDDLRELADLARAIALGKIAPIITDVEQKGTFDPRIRDALGDAGFFGLVVPAERGGLDADVRHQAVVLEEIARVYPSACTYLTAHWLATKIVALNAVGPDEPEWVAPLLADAASGARIGAIAATEPESGSDLSSIRTRAIRDGDTWVIDGSKRFITNGGFADFYTVLARTSEPGAKGISVFHVEADRDGVRATRFEDKMGLHGSATAEMVFDGVRVPADHLIGEEGAGFRYTMRGFNEGRIGVAAMSLGIAVGALDASVTYAAQRRQFGHEIATYQGVQFLVADMSIGVHAARSLIYDAADELVTGGPDATRLAAIAKTYATDMAMAATTDAVQVHGGYGYVRDFPVEMFMRDAKIGQIYEGTNQIQRMLIARTYFGDLTR